MTTFSLQTAAEFLDGLEDTGASITGNDEVIAVYRLNAAATFETGTVARRLGWSFTTEDASQSSLELNMIDDDYGPFSLVIRKPNDLVDPAIRVTLRGLIDLLKRGDPAPMLKCGRATSRFACRMTCISTMDDDAPFEPSPVSASPRRVVREVGNVRLVPERIGLWIASNPGEMPWDDPVLQAWATMAAPNLVRSLANEVAEDTVTFRGPPLVRLHLRNPAPSIAMGRESFAALSQAAEWVFDNEREMEMRQGLFAAEIARLANPDQDAYDTLGRLAPGALESARIAYGLNLSQVNRDSLKAQADLRKAISDEASRLADSTRTLAGAVATALSAGLGVVLAKLTTTLPGWMLVGLTLVLALYVGSVVWSGWKFILVQRSIRSEWRQKLYMFLPDADYRSMVQEPARMAEDAFIVAARSGAVLTGLMFVLVALLVLRHSGPAGEQHAIGAHDGGREVHQTAGAANQPLRPQAVMAPPPASSKNKPSASH